MTMSKPFAAALAAAALTILATCAQEQQVVVERFTVAIAPPVDVAEPQPAPRPDYIWSRGYWSVENGKFQWVAGRWVDRVPGFAYHQPHWGEANGKVFYQVGHYTPAPDHRFVSMRVN
jgi:hypothetical protein